MTYWVKFSERVLLAKEEEKQWWQELLLNTIEPEFELGFGCKLLRDDGGDYVWIYSQRYGDVFKACQTVQAFLKKFVPHGAWGMTWADGYGGRGFRAFGGGAAIVTPYAIQFRTTNSWLVSSFVGFGGVCINTTRER